LDYLFVAVPSGGETAETVNEIADFAGILSFAVISAEQDSDSVVAVGAESFEPGYLSDT